MTERCYHRTSIGRCERVRGHGGWHRHYVHAFPMEWRQGTKRDIAGECPDTIASPDECHCAVRHEVLLNESAPVKP